MPIPRVFVSSTFYDLRYIRDFLRGFIINMGFEPILSEKGNVYYNPSQDRLDAVLAEVSNCQMFVLIIGGRAGEKFKDSPDSIVNHEYRQAIVKRIPIFALVEAPVYSEYLVYLGNKGNRNIDSSKIIYSSVDSCKIFDFMQEVESKAVNNAIHPFLNVDELQSYLRQQWAGLMFDLLTTKATYEREADLFETLSHVEFLAKQILTSVGQNVEKVNTALYEKLSSSELGKIEKYLRVKLSIEDMLESENMSDLFGKAGIKISKNASQVELIPEKGLAATVPIAVFNNLEPDYEKTKKDMLKTLDYYGYTKEDFLNKLKPQKIGKKNYDGR